MDDHIEVLACVSLTRLQGKSDIKSTEHGINNDMIILSNNLEEHPYATSSLDHPPLPSSIILDIFTHCGWVLS